MTEMSVSTVTDIQIQASQTGKDTTETSKLTKPAKLRKYLIFPEYWPLY